MGKTYKAIDKVAPVVEQEEVTSDENRPFQISEPAVREQTVASLKNEYSNLSKNIARDQARQTEIKAIVNTKVKVDLSYDIEEIA